LVNKFPEIIVQCAVVSTQYTTSISASVISLPPLQIATPGPIRHLGRPHRAGAIFSTTSHKRGQLWAQSSNRPDGNPIGNWGVAL